MDIIREITGTLLSILYVVMVVTVTEVYIGRKKNINKENSRKAIHILIAHYIFIVYIFNHSVWFAVIPSIIFIAVNALSIKFNFFNSMKRDTNDSLGTVWYAVSATLVVACTYLLNVREISIISMMILGYGDGLAALIGMKYGKHKLPASKKTLAGTFTMFSVTAVICSVYQYLVYGAIDFKLLSAICILAAFCECIAAKGLDNLLIPFSVSAILICYSFLPDSITIIFTVSLSIVFVFCIWITGALTLPASFITIIMMYVMYFSTGVSPLIGAAVFLIAGSIISIPGNANKNSAKELHKRSGVRSCIQVFANGFITVMLCVIFYFTRLDCIWFGIFVSLAAASSDTFSSEIGMLSKRTPISIVTFKKIKSGLSGGVTFLGFLGSILGSAIAASVILFSKPEMFIGVVIFGVIGSLIDSILGAVLQIKYITSEGVVTERESVNGYKLAVYHGIKWINNDWVNFLGIFLTTLLSVFTYQLLS